MPLEPDPMAAMPLPPPVSKRSVDDTNSPATRTPARFATPPPPDRGRLQASRNGENSNLRSARASGRVSDMVGNRGIDADTLSRALSRELPADRRESTPGASPSRKRQRINADRLVSHASCTPVYRLCSAIEADFPQVHTIAVWPGLTGQLQHVTRGRLSCHPFKTKEAHAAWRAPFSEEYVQLITRITFPDVSVLTVRSRGSESHLLNVIKSRVI